jgi:outer membrane protein TolC
MALAVFDNGLHEGQLSVAKAANAGAAAAYRGAVLKAFQDVEDSLATLNHLADEAMPRRHPLRPPRAPRIWRWCFTRTAL